MPPSPLSVLSALAWGLLLTASLTGWGTLVNRGLRPDLRMDWGLRAGWGLALTILIGGILNLTHSISMAALLLYAGAGVVLWLADSVRLRVQIFHGAETTFRLYSGDRVLLFVAAVIALALSLQYVSSAVAVGRFNIHDDFMGYLVFPTKMLAVGTLGDDPFNARRLVASLGGQSFLHAIVLSAASIHSLPILDQGIGLLLMLGLVYQYAHQLNLPERARVFLLAIVLLVAPPRINTTSLMTGAAAFFTLLRTLESRSSDHSRFAVNGLLVGLATSAICALKTSFVVPAALFLVTNYLMRLKDAGRRRLTLGEFALATLFATAALLPWMLSMYQSSGTLFFPFLGTGYYGSRYGTFPKWTSQVTSLSVTERIFSLSHNGYFLALTALGILALLVRKKQHSDFSEACLSLWSAAMLTVPILDVAIQWGDVYRWVFPILLACIMALLCRLLATGIAELGEGTRPLSNARLPVSLVAVFFFSGWLVADPARYAVKARDWYLMRVKDIVVWTHLDTDPVTQEAGNYVEAQSRVPRGEIILARVSKPFLFDFARNRLFVVDWPGMASPPPGLQPSSPPEALSGYFRTHSIRFIAFSYDRTMFVDPKELRERLASPFLLSGLTARYSVDFDDGVARLRKTRRILYDDGSLVVFDLMMPT